jgi:hypothetical protein
MALRTPSAPNSHYDEQGNKDSVPISDEGLRHITGINSDEEKNIEKRASSPEELSERESEGDDFTYNPSNDQEVTASQPDQLGQGYKKGSEGWSFKRFRKNRQAVMLTTLLASGFIAVVVGMFGLLGSLKLDGLMSNIDSRTFARLQGVEDRRSVAWMQAYMEMRLMDMGDHPSMEPGKEQNVLFRSNRVSTGSPVADWYRTLRTSRFEQQVFEKNGIKFTSVFTAEGKVRPGYIDINGVKSEIPIEKLGLSDITKIQNGDVNTLNKYHDYIGSEFFSNDKEARQAIRQVVNDNTRNWQVFKRRHVRKDIQNMVGVRDWRFFEGTRTKLDEKKIDIRNKIIDKAVPDSTKSGKFIKCLFGISSCNFSEDPSNIENQADGVLNDGTPNNDTFDSQDSNTHKIVAEPVDLGPAADLVKKIGSSVVPVLDALNVVQLLDSISHVDKAIHNHSLSKGVAVAKGVQAMGLYTVFEIARDQMKTGEVNSAEVNQFMQVVGPATASEGYNKVVEGNGDPSKQTAGSEQYCSTANQKKLTDTPGLSANEYAYSCPTQKIGGSNNAQELEKTYNTYMGPVVGPILRAYNASRHFPIIGGLLDFATKVVGDITGKLTSLAISVLGVGGDLKNLTAWVAGKLSDLLGAGPINFGSSGNTMINWVIQGGSYTAESTARANGASLTTAQTAALAQQTLAQYQADQNSQMSSYDRYLALSNPDSLASKSTFALSRVNKSSVIAYFSNLGSMFKNAASVFLSPITHKAAAGSLNGYAAAQFSGIQTFDFPQQCLNLDPITATPQNGTNIQKVIPGITDDELTWDLVTNDSEWYAFVYSKIPESQKDNPDVVSEKIYNCNLLDNSVRGSLGATSGYAKDNGLEDGSSATSADTTTTTNAVAGSILDDGHLFEDSTKVACAPNTKDLGIQDGYHGGTKVSIRICGVPNIPSSSEESNGGFGVTGANGSLVVNSRASGVVYAMAEAAKKNGVALAANSGFRTMAHQQQLFAQNPDPNRVAVPGTSNHQMGLAIDFATLPSSPGPVAGNPIWDWLSKNAASFGYKNYPAEAWHWSPTGN